jgi:FAD/FMN-containing dehydrogenase
MTTVRRRRCFHGRLPLADTADTAAAVRQAYGAARFDRLKGLKRKYDPENLFRLNQNIRPE